MKDLSPLTRFVALALVLIMGSYNSTAITACYNKNWVPMTSTTCACTGGATPGSTCPTTYTSYTGGGYWTCVATAPTGITNCVNGNAIIGYTYTCDSSFSARFYWCLAGAVGCGLVCASCVTIVTCGACVACLGAMGATCTGCVLYVCTASVVGGTPIAAANVYQSDGGPCGTDGGG